MILRQNNFSKYIISILLVITILIGNINILHADPNTIYINTKQDLIDFSNNASLDTYYNGKTVILNTDVEISNIKDFQIPIFNGVFDGNGHTISNLSLSKKGSVQALFRYLSEDGLIKNLNVTGIVAPAGSQDIVGGLVGKNYGTIKNSSFDGTIEGRDNVGGLVGINEATGTISNVIMKGEVAGDHYVGGIAGQNLGTILKSTNHSMVNTSIAESSVDIDSVNWAEINSTENVRAHTDAGGITGFSSGYLQDCVNRGPVGYKHMGYNVGGIAGRQSGYLNNCKNYNTVLGRKDIGGIVGQIEPHLMMVFSEDTLQKINKELNTLQDLFTNTFDSARDSSDDISSQFTNIGNSLDDTRDIMHVLSTDTVDYADHLVDTVNITSERIKYTLEEISPILEIAEDASEHLNHGLDQIEYGFENLKITSDIGASALNESQDAMRNLRQAVLYGENAFSDVERALNNLLDVIDDRDNINQVIDELDNGLVNLGQSFKAGSDALKDIQMIIKRVDPGNPDIVDPGFTRPWPLDELFYPALDDLSNALEDMSKLPSQVGSSIRDIISDGISEITSDAKRDLNNIFSKLESSSHELDRSIKNLQDTFAKLEDASTQSGEAFNDFKNGFNKFADASSSMTEVTESTKDLVDSLVAKPDIKLQNISSEFRQAGDDLFDSMDTISNQVTGMSNILSSSKDNLSDNMKAINNQISVISNVLIDARDNIGEADYVEDISTDNLEDASEGVVYKNQNYGSVEGAVNIGGIAGTMAVEFDLDPEDDIFKQGKRSFNFKYLTTAIINECQNHGNISAKKDNSGGITGLMDLGLISGCENYGNIESQEGNYVGGIAGASYTTIDKSFALSSLSGKNYVGGIAGHANDLSNSYSLVKITDAKEYIGTIAGMSEGEISNNYFVHNNLSGIDGISYTNKAAPISYDELLDIDKLPEAFSNLKISFMADGKIIEETPFDYGDSFDLDDLPPIPFKKGHDSHWEKFNFKNLTFNTLVEAVYTPLKTVLSSKVHRQNGDEELSLLLAEGKFNKDVKLNLSPHDTDLDKIPKKSYRVLEAWNVELENLANNNTDSTLRLLKPDTKRKVTVWEKTKDGPKKLDSSIDGSYIVFPLKGDSATFYITTGFSLFNF